MNRLWVAFALSLCPTAFGQALSSTPSVIMAGLGAPTAQSPAVPCNAGTATSQSTSLYDDRSIAIGNSVWKCKLLTDGVTYSWVAPFVSPFIGTGTSNVITPPTLVGCTTGTANVTGATTAMAATASPIGSPGTGQINSTAYVSAPGLVTITLCLPLTLVYTANPVAYKVLVY